jgi:lactate 2-monooxygenase
MRELPYRDLSIELFGQKHHSPVIVAPIGIQQIVHPDKESGVAEIAADLGLPFVLSNSSCTSIEDAAKANGHGTRWYQLYWPGDDEICISILKRIKASGYTALVLTVDGFLAGIRPVDLDAAYLPIVDGIGTQIAFSDPVFRRYFKEQYGHEIEDNIQAAATLWYEKVYSPGRNWEDLSFLRKHWDGPIIMKGIQSTMDAELAVKYGCEGIIVSNHGGKLCHGGHKSLVSGNN